jgi:V/A-type H+-transporting ATPase subunit E
MAEQPNVQKTSAGVEALISRLREQGVSAGRTDAERMLADAETKARTIVQNADAEAKKKIDGAQAESERLRRAGEDALRAAARDTVLDLKNRLATRFAEDVAKIVATAMRDDALLEKMILAVASRARKEGAVDKAAKLEVVLPRSAVGLDELRRHPEELKKGTLTHFAVAMAGEMLREGVSFSRAEDASEGIRLALLDRGVSIDLTDKAVADMLLVHLQPRFRALLEGVVK